MAKGKIPVVKRSLFSWILPGNGKLQIIIVSAVMVTVFARVLPLEMQKRIINQAIAMKKLDLLYYYCAIYLVSVIAAVGLKYLINVVQTLISEKTLLRMRQEMYAHILTLPLNFFRKSSPGMVVSSLTTELVSAGDFAGTAIALPLINVLTLLAYAAYLFYLNAVLAAVSLSIYPIVLFLVPLLQRGVNKTNKKRVDATREVSSRITETLTGIQEVHGHGSYRIESNKFNKLIHILYKIRISWTIYKQGVKSTNNFFTQLSPFLIFLLGGYLAMSGQLELGALVAFLSAQERLYSPWTELIAMYDLYQDATVRYKRTMEYFDTEPEFLLLPDDRPPYELGNDIEIKDLNFVTEDGISLLNNINLSMKPGEHLALVGFSGSGKSTLAQCIGQLYKYSSGHVQIGEKEVTDMTKLDLVRNVGIVSQQPFIFNGTVEENLLYSWSAMSLGEETDKKPDLDEIITVLQQTGVFVDVLRFGLNAILTPDKHPELVDKIVKIRKNFQSDFGDELADYVEFLNENNYLYHASVSDNLTFGTANQPEFSDEKLPQNEYFTNFLVKADLMRPLLSLGAELAKRTVEILHHLPSDDAFFEHSLIAMEEREEYLILVERLKRSKLHKLPDEDRTKLLGLALKFMPGRHKMVGLPAIMEKLILEGRAFFRDKITEDHPGAFTFFDMDNYIFSQTILNNILFGKTITGRQETQEKINRSIIQLLIEEELLEEIVGIGMQFEVGSKGDRLSGGQRQKLAIARTFLKKPRLLIMDEATSALDNQSQARIQNQLDTNYKDNTTVIAVVHRLDITKNYDRIAVMKAGNIVEVGTYDELLARKGMLYELVVGKN